MRKSLVLEILAHFALCGTNLLIGALSVTPGMGLGGGLRRLERIAADCPHDFSSYSRDQISSALSRMKKQKLVVANGPKKKTIWSITKRGRAHFKALGQGDSLPPEDGQLRLFAYDIPEAMKRHRIWLRVKLAACDYRFLQKSVWLGTRPLPKELRDELKKRRILQYIHVIGLEKFLNETERC